MKLPRRFLSTLLLFVAVAMTLAAKPRVFITTDLNDGKGDPDDGQSLAHLLWYSDWVDISGIGLDRPDAGANQVADAILDLYARDYSDPANRFKALGMPTADQIRARLCRSEAESVDRLKKEALASPDPLWVLGWGNLETVARALREHPEIAPHIRLISIGSNIRDPFSEGDGRLGNWNGGGRAKIFSAFPQLWWLEIDWTYNGMFPGDESVALKETLAARGGALGRKISDLIATVDWASNFRAGDTPSLLYLLDPDNNTEDPGAGSWAGRFVRPFPEERPRYWTDFDGGLGWNHGEPVKTWERAKDVYAAAVSTLLERRPAMYAALLQKIDLLYPRPNQPAASRARVIALTDGEVDDQSSFVRFLLYAAEFDLEGVVATNSVWQKDGHGLGWIHQAIDHYEKSLPSLSRHDPAFPSAEHLRAISVLGDEDRSHLDRPPPHGDTAGSELLVKALVSRDPRPLWVPVWGGANTLAQALWRLKTTLPKLDYVRAVSKLRAYCISFQDAGGSWIAANVPEAICIEAGSWHQTWNYHPQILQPFPEYMGARWVEKHLRQGHGPLAAWYPQNEISEGDTPSFLGLIDNGLNVPEWPSLGGWGGRFAPKQRGWWVDEPDVGSAQAALSRWTPETQRDFAARLDWCVRERDEANHAPHVRLQGTDGTAPVFISARPGQRITLSAAGTTDPDGHAVRFRWYAYPKPISEGRDWPRPDPLGATLYPGGDAEFEWVAPKVSQPTTVSFVVEVVDTGKPALVAYRRAVIRIYP